MDVAAIVHNTAVAVSDGSYLLDEASCVCSAKDFALQCPKQWAPGRGAMKPKITIAPSGTPMVGLKLPMSCWQKWFSSLQD